MPAPAQHNPIPQVFLGRQPILDRQQQLFAYKLLFRCGHAATGNRAQFDDPTQASATVIANACAELSTQPALGRTRCLIGIDHELLFSELLEALPAQRIALDILDRVAPLADVVARCRQLRELGFMLAVDGSEADVGGAATPRALLALADVIKIDIARSDAGQLAARLADLKPLGRLLLAEKVESHEQFELCQRLGFDLFQGYHFARPTIIVGHKLTPARLSLLRLLALVAEDAETSAIENAFKREPGLTVNMLRLTNSVSNGLATKITSLRHAITLLGRRSLQRWLQLLVYSGAPSSAPGANPLLKLAATRGRLMELLAARSHGSNRELTDQAFMVGIISLMPALLGVALPELLAHLPVAARVRQALIERSGVHGELLQLVEATEQADPMVLEEALRRHRPPTINAEVLDAHLAQALAWASQLGDENHDDD